MAWSPVYYGEWYDFKGNFNRVELLTETAGEAVEVTVTAFTIEHPTVNYFSEQCTFGAGGNLSIISETPLKYLETLYIENRRGMRFYHYLNSVLNFIGFVDSEQYQDPFSDRLNYNFSITANNGLSILETLGVMTTGLENLTGVTSTIALIKLCFDRLGLPYTKINIGLSLDIEDSLLTTTENVLQKLYLKAENFYDEEESAMTCRELLNNICLSLGAKLYINKTEIYILDVNILRESSLVTKVYSYSTLAYIETATIANLTVLNERIGAHNLTMTPGINNLAISLNKYAMGSNKTFPIDATTLNGYIEGDVITTSKGQYVERRYSANTGFEKLNYPLQSIFVNSYPKSTIEGAGIEFFLRCSPPVTGNYMIRIPTGIFVASTTERYIQLSGNVLFENTGVDKYGQEYDLSVKHMGFYWRAVITQESTDVGWYANPDAQDIETTNDADWYTTVKSNPIYTTIRNDDNEDTKVKGNKWYSIDDGVTLFYPRSSRAGAPFETFVMKGGYVSIEIYVPSDLETMNMCFTGLEVTFKQRIYEISQDPESPVYSRYLNLIDIETEDSVTHGSATDVFIEDEEITSNLGTDDELNTRANYLLVVDGPYTDSYSSTLERYVCAATFLKTVDAETISGTLEELLLNSYLSNLKQSRYLLTLTIMAKLAETGIEAYPPMFRNYTFALLTRDSVAVYLIPTQMTIDYVSSQISLTLLEYVKDLGND